MERHAPKLFACTLPDIALGRDPWAELLMDHAVMGVSIEQSLYENWVRTEGMLIGEEVMAGLAAYRADNGRYPETFDDLVPCYLPGVPPDPWTGDPLVHRRDGRPYTLYARGENRADNGGSR